MLSTYTFMSRYQNEGQNRKIKIANKFVENVAINSDLWKRFL